MEELYYFGRLGGPTPLLIGRMFYDRAFLREDLLGIKKCVAVGECGLDYYRLPKDNNQKRR